MLGGAIGSFVEFYEFAIYAALSTTLAIVFFPAVSPATALLSTLAVFAVAFSHAHSGGSCGAASATESAESGHSLSRFY
ncbi:MAG TPA: hypothetical protein VG674_15890 [Amycolatopsis sp.]|nr:hypothetical protein [Amycolatopsis sp.]